MSEFSTPKRICVELKTEGFPTQQRDISFISDKEKSDLTVIEEELRRKSKRLFDKLSPETVVEFKKPSEVVSGTWSVIGDDSPVKDKSKLLAVCFVPHNPSFTSIPIIQFEKPRAASSPISATSSIMGKRKTNCCIPLLFNSLSLLFPSDSISLPDFDEPSASNVTSGKLDYSNHPTKSS